MTEAGTPTTPPADPVGRALFRLAYGLAIAGGTMMIALVAMVVVSILGRGLINSPVYGDFELVAMGTGIGVSLALPYCHLCRGNVIVDLFLARAPLPVRIACDVFGSLILAVLAATLTWRTILGAREMIANREVTIILAIPVWWAFPFVILSLGLLALCAMYTACRDAKGLLA